MEDRYHATAIETGEHLLRCIVYVDLNMVRAGVVEHPKDWSHGGYIEMQHPRCKNILIDYGALAHLCDYDNFKIFSQRTIVGSRRPYPEIKSKEISTQHSLWIIFYEIKHHVPLLRRRTFIQEIHGVYPLFIFHIRICAIGKEQLHYL